MCEMSMCLIHSPPKLFEGCFDIVMLSDVATGGEITGNYSYDSIISIAMLLRVYMPFRLFHFCCGNLSSGSWVVAMFNKVNTGPWVTFRRSLEDRPSSLIGMLMMMSVLMYLRLHTSGRGAPSTSTRWLQHLRECNVVCNSDNDHSGLR
jgi:hypothetical protein